MAVASIANSFKERRTAAPSVRKASFQIEAGRRASFLIGTGGCLWFSGDKYGRARRYGAAQESVNHFW